mmetsp:Transcript_21697/g.60610  ORF Transcript_21697/g.60610 Transcript_21697/m.60610 type:complete len:248 (+) Transcript_21697:61-804(+)
MARRTDEFENLRNRGGSKTNGLEHGKEGSGLGDQLRQRPHHGTSATRRVQALGFVGPNWPCDVEVRPRDVLPHELLQEERRGDGAPHAWTCVFHVGEVALEAFEIALLQGHPPYLLSSCVCRLAEALRKIVGVAPHAGDAIAERNHASTCQRRHVYYLADPLILAIQQGVGQGQAPLGVSVVHFDGGAIHGSDDVARVQRARVPADHVLARGHHKVHLDVWRLQLRNGGRRAQRRRRAAHVEFHHFD